MGFQAGNLSSSIYESLSQQQVIFPSSPPLLRFEFENNACSEGIFANSGSLTQSSNLIRDSSTTACAPGSGAIGVDILRPSTVNVDHSSPSALLGNLNSLWSALGLEPGAPNKAFNHDEAPPIGIFEKPAILLNLWLDLFQEEAQQQKYDGNESEQLASSFPILTIGNSMDGHIPPVDQMTECDRRQVDLQVSILPQGRRRYRRLQPLLEGRTKSALEILFRTSDEYYEPCQRIVIDNFDDFLAPSRSIQVATRNPGNITRTTTEINARVIHLAIVLADEHQQAFVNGQPSVRLQEPFDAATLSHWREYHKSSSTATSHGDSLKKSELQFFPHKRSSIPDHYSSSSLPSKSALWLARLYQFELYQVELPTNLEECVLEMMAHGILPEFLHDTLFGPPPPPPPNNPPRAVIKSPQPFVVSEGLEELSPLNGGGVLWLGGVDTDPGDQITALEVLVPPEWGELILSVHTRRQDGIAHGTLLSDLAFLINGSQFPVEYRFHGGKSIRGSSSHFNRQRHPQPFVVMGTSSSPYNHRTNIAKDSFSFRVCDTHGQWSEPVRAIVQLESSLWALTKVSNTSYYEHDVLQRVEPLFRNSTLNDYPWEHKVRTGDTLSITLVGMDSSGLNRSMGFYFESTMDIKLGTLSLTGKHSTILKAGDIISSIEATTTATSTASAKITFQASPEACDAKYLDKSRRGSEVKTSIGYRVVAYDDDSGRISSVSDLVFQNIFIHCKILPIDFSFVDQAISSISSSTSRNNDSLVPSISSSTSGNNDSLVPSFEVRAFHGTWDDPCSGYMFEKTILNASDIIGIENERLAFQLVQCSSALILHGWFISTTVAHTEKIKVTILCQNGLLTISPRLVKEGLIRPLKDQMVMRSTLQFLVDPKHLSEALSFIHFQSPVVGTDEVEISIQYGDCSSSGDGEGNEDIPANGTNANETDAYECFQTTRKLSIQVLEPLIDTPTETMFNSFPWIPLPATIVLLLVIKLKGKARSILSEATSESNFSSQNQTLE